MNPTCLEVCAGGGGQAIGLEQAGFEAQVLVEIDSHCCNTLRHNRPLWNVVEQDLHTFTGHAFKGVDLFAGGVPCPPFSKAGKQLGQSDERDLFPEALRIIDETRPKAVMLENVRGFLDKVFDEYRHALKTKLNKMGYVVDWQLLNASDYGVSQLRPRVVIVGLKKVFAQNFVWPEKQNQTPLTVGKLLHKDMASAGWRQASEWARRANDIAPTIVGGSKKHGGPDLGPTRAKKAWENLGVDGKGIANAPPAENFSGNPRLTVDMVAKIQGFPDDWHFTGKKTPAYRQVGNAFPPPVAKAVAQNILQCISTKTIYSRAS